MNKRSRPRNLRRLSLGLLAAGLALAGTGVLEQRLRMERDAAEYDQWRVTLKHIPAAVTAEATPTPLNARSTAALFPAYLLPVTAMPEASGAPGVTGKVEASSAASEAGAGTRANLAACLAQNADFVAWLQIPGTNVDHPVVRTGNPDYYLTHAFSGKKSSAGTLFSLLSSDYRAPSRNLAIYGHHLSSSGEKMFTSLMRYKDPEFYSDHETIYLDTLYRQETSRIFAVVSMHAGDWDASCANFATDEAFLAFVRRAREQSLYDTGVDVQASDRVLTLITCDRSYGGKDGRLVVMAVRETTRERKEDHA